MKPKSPSITHATLNLIEHPDEDRAYQNQHWYLQSYIAQEFGEGNSIK